MKYHKKIKNRSNIYCYSSKQRDESRLQGANLLPAALLVIFVTVVPVTTKQIEEALKAHAKTERQVFRVNFCGVFMINYYFF